MLTSNHIAALGGMSLTGLILALTVSVASAADNNLLKSAYAPPSNSPQAKLDPAGSIDDIRTNNVLVFSSPPRETVDVAMETYGPIAELLSAATGIKFEYRQPGNWLTYQTAMQQDEYDVVFDDPHFVSWRIAKRRHEPLVKIPGDFKYVFLARSGDDKLATVSDLAGRRVCGNAPPDQGTLRLYSMFDNPVRQPVLRNVTGWRNIYSSMVESKCDAAIMPLNVYKEIDPNGIETKVLHVTERTPGQAFTVSMRIPEKMRQQIAEALLSAEGLKATSKLRQRYSTTTYVRARPEEYAGIQQLLKGTWGFDK